MTEEKAEAGGAIVALLKRVQNDPSLLQAIAILSSAGLGAQASGSKQRVEAWAYAITKERVRAVQEHLKNLANEEAVKADLDRMAAVAQKLMDRIDELKIEDDVETGHGRRPFG